MKIGIDMFFKNFSKIDFLIFGSLASIVVASITVDTVLDVAAYNKDKNYSYVVDDDCDDLDDIIIDSIGKEEGEGLTEPETEPATEPPTEPETEPATEPPTEPVTEPLTEPPTEPPTMPPTQAATEPPKQTQAPTPSPTNPPTSLRQEPIGLSKDQWETEYTDVMLEVFDFKQYDERWGSVKIYDKTIKQVGCLITCVSELYSYKNNVTVYPGEMRYKLSFVRNLLIWESVQTNGLTCSQEYGYSIGPNILNNIYKKLKSGKPVIIGGTTQKAGEGGQHWIVIKGYVSDETNELKTSNFIINDPGGTQRVTLADFLNNYPYVKRLVY